MRVGAFVLRRGAPVLCFPDDLEGGATLTSQDVERAWEELFRGLDRLRSGWPSSDWTYDGRLSCVTSSIPIAAESAARVVIAEIIPTSWTASTLPQAPDEVQALAARCGGLRASQLLFWGGEPGRPSGFGLWWPWGNGTTVSLRIGLHDVEPPTHRYPRLRSVFGIPEPASPA